MHIEILPVLAAGFAAWVFGAVWYTVLGKAWQAALGMDPEGCRGKPMPVLPLLVSLLASCVIALMLSRILPDFGVKGWMAGAGLGFLIGATLLLTTNLVNNMFQQKKAMVTVIDGSHWVLAATIQGAVLGLLL